MLLLVVSDARRTLIAEPYNVHALQLPSGMRTHLNPLTFVTMPHRLRAAAAVFQRLYGVTVQEDEFIPFGGQGEGPFLTGVAHKHSVASFDLPAAIAAFFDIYCNTYATREAGIGFPGAVELVRSCRAAGLRTAVASSAGRVKVDANLRAGGFEPSDFDSIVSAEDITLNKPHPDIFLVAARNVGVAPANCVVMEDAAAGVRAGKAAGCRVLGVMTTLSSAELTAEGADATVSCISNVALADLQALRYRQPAAAR